MSAIEPASSAPHARSTNGHIAVLDGLRFVAAFVVAAAHFIDLPFKGPENASGIAAVIKTFAGLGMTLFFVLSGFVIHYNYRRVLAERGGFRAFAVARFARLYPLYIVLFGFTFLNALRRGGTGCAAVGDPMGALLALPAYLTLTQDWAYGVICKASVIYQYGAVAAVSWSISAEVLFYLAYAAFGRGISARPAAALVWLAIGAYVAVFAYVGAVEHFIAPIDRFGAATFGPVASLAGGADDAFVRWLTYFNPAVQIVHFIGGVAACQVYLAGRSRVGPSLGAWLVVAALAAVVAAHLFVYGQRGFLARSTLYGPLVVVLIYLAVRFHETLLPWLLSRPLLVKLGEASYSLYLLHAAFFGYPLKIMRLGVNPWAAWFLCLVAVIGLSRLSYVWFEGPARSFLRRRFGSREGVPVATGLP